MDHEKNPQEQEEIITEEMYERYEADGGSQRNRLAISGKHSIQGGRSWLSKRHEQARRR